MPFIHGHKLRSGQSRTYSIWCAMRTRCSNPRQKTWYLYGGRGIAVCERWNSFQKFLEDMGECPEGYSLDRLDSNGNYEANNCRWATPLQQSRNSRHARILTYKNQSFCVTEWAEKMGINIGALKGRLKRGWDIERALTQPVSRENP